MNEAPGTAVQSQPGVLQAWVLAARPRTLPLAVVPVVVGSALAYAEHQLFSPFVFFMAITVALLLQIGANLHNDVADFQRGADDPDSRLGPQRVTAEGWLPAALVRRIAMLTFLVAFLAGLSLISVGGWPILAVGVISVAAGLAYSGGPWPISHTCFGELVVWLFFGLVAVAGTWYLQAGASPGWSALAAGTVVGLPAAAVLVVNNARDRDQDLINGRRTFPVIFGLEASRREYLALILVPLPLSVWVVCKIGGWWGLPLLILPMAVWLIRRFSFQSGGPALNRLLADTARYGLFAGLLLALGLLAGQWA